MENAFRDMSSIGAYVRTEREKRIAEAPFSSDEEDEAQPYSPRYRVKLPGDDNQRINTSSSLNGMDL